MIREDDEGSDYKLAIVQIVSKYVFYNSQPKKSLFVSELRLMK